MGVRNTMQILKHWPLICICWIASSGIAFAGDHKDVIDLTAVHQTIENFGASDAWSMQRIGAWSQASKEKVADLLFSTDKGIGLSLWRFNIGGGINHRSISRPWRTAETFEVAEGQYDWTRQANQRWFARAARERGVPYLLGFVNSPPGRMTRSGLTNSDDDQTSTTNLKPGFEKQYARYLCDIVEHFRDAPEAEKLTFNYLSPVNEPQIEWNAGSQEGNRASNDDIRKILLALRDEVRSRGLDVKIRSPETSLLPDLWQLNAKATKRWNADYGNYLQAFAADPAMSELLDQTICYHEYTSFKGPYLESDHLTLGQKMAAYPGSRLWMSEICILEAKRDLGMDMAIDVAKLIHADLAVAGAAAWQWWLAVSESDYKDGLLYTNWRRPGDPESIIESKTLWALGNFSRFIRPGMRRVELKGDSHAFNGLLGSAYTDAATGKLVLVYINTTPEPQRVVWIVKARDGAMTPSTFTPYITSETENLSRAAAIAVDAGATIPARAVVTFVSSDQ